MEEFNIEGNEETNFETFPVKPYFHPVHKATKRIYNFFASAKLAMFLLVVILCCSVSGVTIVREKKAWDLIFSTVWFNSILVLLVINVACCFFGRIWGRRVTLVSLGMILFHLSFVTLFLGVVYNSLFYFRGTIRLTEGETLPNGDPQSYDSMYVGRFFRFTSLKGETTLIKMHTGFKDGGQDKRVAYEVAIGDGGNKIHDRIYVTKHVNYRGIKYFPDSEGYSVLTIMYDANGREVHGVYLPLQSLRNSEGIILYTTGSKDGPSAVPFPTLPAVPMFKLNVAYYPNKEMDRSGEVSFDLYPSSSNSSEITAQPITSGKAKVGEVFSAGTTMFAAKEIRYWTAMAVRYEPGQPIILTSLWVGLFGTTLTTMARMFRRKPVQASHL